MDSGVSVADLRWNGVTPMSLKEASVSMRQLSDAGFSAETLMRSGFPIQDIVSARYTVTELKACPMPITVEKLRVAGCHPQLVPSKGPDRKHGFPDTLYPVGALAGSMVLQTPCARCGAGRYHSHGARRSQRRLVLNVLFWPPPGVWG